MEQQKITEIIWDKFDKIRDDAPPALYGQRDFKILVLLASKFGIKKLDEIFEDKELLSSLMNSFSITAPTYIYKFINEILKTNISKVIFDPWVTISSPVHYIQKVKYEGICYNERQLEIIKSLFKKESRDLTLGNPLKDISDSNKKYDIVVSFPPFGMKTQNINGNKSRFDFATTLLLRCGDKVKDDGKIVFLVSNAFFMKKEVKETLNKKGLFVEAVFAISAGTFNPITGIASNLIIVSKKRIKNTFIAELSQDKQTNQKILDNFKKHKEGKIIQLGCYVDISEFRSFSTLVSNNEMNDLGKKFGYPSVPLSDISLSINLLKSNNIEDIEHLSNSVYLPKIGKSNAVSSLSDLNIKPRNYFQIQLDPSKANAQYVSNYLNTQIGEKLRRSIESGSSILQISKSQLSKSVLFLPNIDIQTEILEVNSNIKQISFKLAELKNKLWKFPKSHKSVKKELKTINNKEKLENWVDTLPFPISSILWRYYASEENSSKIEHLFHFFEAFSEFLSMLMLSALIQDDEFYKKECHQWVEEDEKFQEWYLKATFGNWNILTSKLSKAIRKYLSDKDEKEHCKSLFGNPNDAFLSMITNKKMINILFEVANHRNKWKGHGGITSKQENNQRILALEQHLNDFRKQISNAFEDIRILSPNKSSFEDGVFTFNAKELLGARTPFNEITIESLIPLDKKKLYLYNTQQSRPLELLPFIKFVESSNAIYYYSSIESKDVRWVSYHFEKKSELKQPPNEELFKAFDLLKPQ